MRFPTYTVTNATVSGNDNVGGLIGWNDGGKVDATNYFYSNVADSSGAARVYKITVPSGVTVTGAREIDGNYYAPANTSITLSEEGKSIRSATGATGTTNFTPTADTTISALEYYSGGEGGTSLQSGTFEIDSYAEKIGNKIITALGTYLQVTAENGEVTSIKDIHIGEKFSVEENGETSIYEQTAVVATYENGILTAGKATIKVSGDDDFTFKAADDTGVTLEGISDGAEFSGTGEPRHLHD